MYRFGRDLIGHSPHSFLVSLFLSPTYTQKLSLVEVPFSFLATAAACFLVFQSLSLYLSVFSSLDVSGIFDFVISLSSLYIFYSFSSHSLSQLAMSSRRRPLLYFFRESLVPSEVEKSEDPVQVYVSESCTECIRVLTISDLRELSTKLMHSTMSILPKVPGSSNHHASSLSAPRSARAAAGASSALPRSRKKTSPPSVVCISALSSKASQRFRSIQSTVSIAGP